MVNVSTHYDFKIIKLAQLALRHANSSKWYTGGVASRERLARL
jgi:hypothetical protein